MVFKRFQLMNGAWREDLWSSPLKLSTLRLIHAGPTCGKGGMMSQLAARNVPCFDTDQYLAVAAPWWFERRLYARADLREASLRLHRHAGAWVHRTLYADGSVGQSVVLTNLWSEEFAEEALRTLPSRIRFGVFRESPDEIVELSKSRGGVGISLDLASKWVAEFKEHARDVFQEYVLLCDAGCSGRTFLSDCLDVTYPWALPSPLLSPEDIGLEVENVRYVQKSLDGNRGGGR